MNLQLSIEAWPLRAPFRITGSIMTCLNVVAVTLRQNEFEGRGEAAGVDYLGETVETMVKQIEAARSSIELGIQRDALREILPPGGARNAIDCALWDLEAKRSGKPVWQSAGLTEPRPLVTTHTLGADAPAAMAAAAIAAPARAIKLKLTGEPEDAQRVRAVREVRSDVWLAVDANQGFSHSHFMQLMPTLIGARVALVEQPFPIGQEPALAALNSSIPIAADESAQGVKDLANLVGRFNVINIKLDKCGGLTEALLMAREARHLGFDLMVGNMVGTSLAMAPAYLIGQLCRFVDLDGPLFLREDRPVTATYTQGSIRCDAGIWGGESV